MKKFFLSVFAISIIVVSCSKNSGNKAVIENENNQSEQVTTDSTETLRYVTPDGSNTHVTFLGTDQNSQIEVKSGQLTLLVPFAEKTDEGTFYRRDDIEIRSWGDSLTIEQGENIIELKKARGQ